MKNTNIFIHGLLIGFIFFLAGAGIFFLSRVQDKKGDPAPVSDLPSGKHAETGYFDLRNTKEVLIDITGNQFTPRHILINKGTKVIWRNDDEIAHVVDGKVFLSPELKKGKVFVQIFGVAGSYPYHCGNHPEMEGLIVVK